MAIYAAGFPCKAFSKLRAHTLWLDDPQAKQFFEVTRTIQAVQPIAACLQLLCNDDDAALAPIFFPAAPGFEVALLENVLGIKPVLPEVLDHLRKMLPQYEIMIRIVDPFFGLKRLVAVYCSSSINLRKMRKLLGVNVSRRRYYFFLVLKDYLAVKSMEEQIQSTFAQLETAFPDNVPWQGPRVVKTNKRVMYSVENLSGNRSW